MNVMLRNLRTLAELGRISNLPTTFTNLLVGAAIGIRTADSNSSIPWWMILIAWLAVASFYIAGMAMNDLFDAEIDARERPRRAIPSGRISRNATLAFISALTVLSLTLLWQINHVAMFAGAGLLVFILLYNATHGRFAASVVLLGFSRAMVYVIGAAAISPELNWQLLSIYGGALALYTAAFSLIARNEMREIHYASQLKVIALLLPVIALAPVPFSIEGALIFVPLGFVGALLGAYLLFRLRIRDAVMMWIAAICLIDAMYLGALGQPLLAVIAIGCFAVTVLSQRLIAGT